MLLFAKLRRDTVERLAKSETFSHVRVVDCAQGRDINVGTEPQIGKIRLNDFNAVKKLLGETSESRSCEMRSMIFARAGDFRLPACLRFDGGSYLGRKIVSAGTPITLIDHFP